MTTEDISPELRALLDVSPDSPGSADATDEAFRRLVDVLWADGMATDAASAALPELLTALETVDPSRAGHLVFVLGLLAESGPAAHDQVRAGVGRLLELLDGHPDDDRLVPALLYALGQFPTEREAIEKIAGGAGLETDDASRLHRSLGAPDLQAPSFGRTWPSPAVWSLTDAERAIDLGWMRRLPAEQVRELWDRETGVLRAYAGAKALRALGGGVTTPRPAPPPPATPRASSTDSDSGTATSTDVLGGHDDVLRCLACHGRLTAAGEAARCEACALRFDAEHGYLDLAAHLEEGVETLLLRDPIYVPRYPDGLRPAFVRVIGDAWAGQLTPADEDRYLTDHVAPVAGPIADIACGPGRSSRVLAAAFGPERVLALDLAGPMLALLHSEAPDIRAVRAPAVDLPLADASLGAAVCWNSLQALPDPAAVIAEVGRCLRPGGTFSLLTFTTSADPLYRHFQDRHTTPLGISLLDPADLRTWLGRAGLEPTAESSTGTCLFMTARRTDVPYAELPSEVR